MMTEIDIPPFGCWNITAQCRNNVRSVLLYRSNLESVDGLAPVVAWKVRHFGKVAPSTRDSRIFFVTTPSSHGLRIPLNRRASCSNRRMRHNPRTSNGPVRRYPPQASLVILPPLAIAAFVGSGSAQSTLKTKRGIAALSSQGKRVAKYNLATAMQSQALPAHS